MNTKPYLQRAGLITAILATLVACGGKDSAPISSVKVFGDSLADGGTFGGVRATVQSGDSNNPTPMYPDLVAKSFSAAKLCQHYSATGSGFAASNNAANCSNFAIGGSRILAPAADAAEYNITKQLSDAASKYGAYTPFDLLLIDGAGNDAADIVTAYLTSPAAFAQFLSRGVDAATLTPLLAAGKSSEAGAIYMENLAGTLTNSVKNNALNRGALYVAILNAPLVTHTPRFKTTLAQVSAAYGSAAAAGVQALTTAWVQAYNAKLAANFSGDKRVVIVDFYADFNAQVANPGSYGISNSTTPACEALGAVFTNFAACTAAALSALQPANPDWWKKYAYSDGFHPTPFGHEMIANNIARAFKNANWQ